MAYAIGPSASNLLGMPFQSVNPFGPAGITDLTRQGWLTQLQGMGAQFGPAQQYAAGMGGLANMANQAFLGGMQGGQFATNPWMQHAAGMASSAGGNPLWGLAGQQMLGAGQQPGFGLGMDYLRAAPNQGELGAAAGLYGGALSQPWLGEAAGGFRTAQHQPYLGAAAGGFRTAAEQPGFGEAAAGARNVLGQYGGGWSGDLASDIGRTGASFDPYNNPALAESISQANQLLARDFQEGALRGLNQSAAGAGPGAFGGTRAGVAQGIAERGLADAMARQTGDMLSRGYEAGLNRYVQDRASTLGTTIDALRQGSMVGLEGSQLLGNLAQAQGALGMQGAQGLAGLGSTLGQLGMQGAQGLAGLGGTMGQLGLGAAGGLADLGLGRGQLGISAGTGIGDIAARQGQLGLGIGQGLGSLAGAQGNQMLAGAGQLGNLGLGALGQQNNMFQFGFGQMMPSMLQQAYQAGLQPGQIMQDMGGAMAGMGGAQQATNQAMLDWYNSQAMQRQMWPWEQLGRYQQAIGPIINTPGQQNTATTQTMPGQPGPSPWQAGIGGAMTGMGLWNLWNQNRNPGAGYPAGDAYMPGAMWPQGGGGGGGPGSFGF